MVIAANSLVPQRMELWRSFSSRRNQAQDLSVTGLHRGTNGASKMRAMSKVALGAITATSILAISAMSASAAVVCRGNVCWHTHDSYAYPPSARVIIPPDDWAGGPGITFREHEGRDTGTVIDGRNGKSLKLA
jgi:hypothetical protein